MAKKFKPKLNENYWMINSRWEVKQAPFTGTNKARDRVSVGNSFKSKIEAELFREKLMKNVPMSRLDHLKAFFNGR